MVKLTKQEKLARKEAQRLARLKAEDETRKQTKKDELKQAMDIQAVKRTAIDKKWVEIMAQIKQPVFQKSINDLWMTFERANDTKDAIILHILNQIDKVEDQHGRSITNCLAIIEKQLKIFLHEITNKFSEYQRQSEQQIKTYTNNKTDSKQKTDAAEMHLQLILYDSNINADSKAWIRRGKYMATIDEENQKSKELNEKLRSQHEGTYTSIWESYKQVIKKYITNTTENRKKIKFIRRKEDKMSDIIAFQQQQMKENYMVLRRLKRELFSYESGQKQAEFRARRDHHRNACKNMKSWLKQSCNGDNAKLDNLVFCSSGAIDALINMNEKFIRALNYVKLCRKYETHNEKILPVGAYYDVNTVIEKNNKKSLRRPKKSSNTELFDGEEYSDDLDILMNRIHKVNLMIRALKREKQILIKDNAMMLKELRKREDSPSPTSLSCICEEVNCHPPSICSASIIVRPSTMKFKKV